MATEIFYGMFTPILRGNEPSSQVDEQIFQKPLGEIPMKKSRQDDSNGKWVLPPSTWVAQVITPAIAGQQKVWWMDPLTGGVQFLSKKMEGGKDLIWTTFLEKTHPKLGDWNVFLYLYDVIMISLSCDNDTYINIYIYLELLFVYYILIVSLQNG